MRAAKICLAREFILDKHDILVVQAVEELLKNQLIEAIDEDYILELRPMALVLVENKTSHQGRPPVGFVEGTQLLRAEHCPLSA